MRNMEIDRFVRWLAKAQLRTIERKTPWYYRTPARITQVIIAVWMATVITVAVFIALVISFAWP